MKDDKRYLRSRQAIDQAVWELLHIKNFEQISVEEIASRADINRVTFYRHYDDKYAWLEEKINDLTNELHPVFHSILDHSDMQIQLVGFREILVCLDKHYDLFSVLLRNEGKILLEQRLLKMMRFLLLEQFPKQIKFDADMEFNIQFVTSASVGIILWWIEEERPLTIDQMAAKMQQIYAVLPWNQNLQEWIANQM